MADGAVTPEAIAAVLAAMDDVFGGKTEYDDCFETLNVHVATAKRTYPNLMRVLKNPPGNTNAVLAVLDDGTMHDVGALVAQIIDGKLSALAPVLVTAIVTAMPKPVVQQLMPVMQSAANGEEMRPVREPVLSDDGSGVRVYDYQLWSKVEAQTSQIGQKWAINWDSEARRFQPGETATIRGDGARYRYAIREDREDGTQIWELIKLLPFSRG